MRQIIITGPPRSGTTLLGNIIGSCDKVEYFFEPPIMSFLLRNLINKVDTPTWKSIYDYYVNYELINESLAGRRLNFNPNDDTFIYKTKSKSDIDFRISKSWRSSELEEIKSDYLLAFKTPGVGSWVNKIDLIDKKIKFIIIIRNLEDTILSIQNKGWFKDDPINIVRPSIKFNNTFIPDIIPSDRHDEWVNSNEYIRILMYLRYQFRFILNVKNATILNYDILVKNKNSIYKIIEELSLTKSAKTDEIINSIDYTRSRYRRLELEDEKSMEYFSELQVVFKQIMTRCEIV